MADGPDSAPSMPSGPGPVALLIAHGLVTKQRLRLTDPRDGRLGELGQFPFELGAASWTGKQAAFVGFYTPPLEPAAAAADLEARLAAAQHWGEGRLSAQDAERCDILLIALGPVGSAASPSTANPAVRMGALAAHPDSGEVAELLSVPSGLPGTGELRKAMKYVQDGGAVPTLAAVDLAERQTVAGGYSAPARSAMASRPIVTYSLIGTFVGIWLLDQALHKSVLSQGQPATVYPLNEAGAFVPSQVGDWWRAIGFSFLHLPDTPWHVAVNSYSMFVIGRLVEQLYGRLALLGAFLVSGLASAGAVYLGYVVGITGDVPTVGASGGLCGLIGLLLLLGRFQGKNVPVGMADAIRRMASINAVLILVYTFAIPGISKAGHVGGFIGGALVGLIVPPLARVGGRDLHLVERVVIGAVLVGTAVALVAMAIHAADIIRLVNSLNGAPSN